MYVDDKPTHFQMGRMQSYDLRCELFEYSSERIDTGDVDIDLIEDVNSLNVLDNQFTLEDDAGVLKNEDGNTVLQEFAIESVVPDADNTFLDVQGESILDFSEGNPFSEVDRY
jgi:hypothetical protein